MMRKIIVIRNFEGIHEHVICINKNEKTQSWSIRITQQIQTLHNSDLLKIQASGSECNKKIHVIIRMKGYASLKLDNLRQ